MQLSSVSLDEIAMLTSQLKNYPAKQSVLSSTLKEEHDMANAIIEHAGLLVVVLDKQGRIIRFNQACQKLTGYSFEDVKDQLLWEILLPPQQAKKLRQEAFKTWITGKGEDAQHYINEWVSRDGKRHLIEFTNTLVLDEDDNVRLVMSIGINITEKKQAETEILLSREQLQEAQRIANLGSWSLDLQTNRLEWSNQIFALFEVDKENFKASYEYFLELVHPDDRDMVNEVYQTSLQTRKPYQITHRLLFPDGRIKFVEERCETLYSADGTPTLSRGTVQDVTEKNMAREEIQLYKTVIQQSAQGVIISDSANRIIAVNPAMIRLTGYDEDELIGKNPNILSSGLTPEQTYKDMWAALQDEGHWQGELVDRRKDGSTYPKWISISVVKNDLGDITNYIANFSDISERKASEQRIHYLAHHDALTGLHNRYSLEQLLTQSISQAQRLNRKLAVLFIDLDRFKIINDTLGHTIGDQLLKDIAQRLNKSIRDSDIVARLGGDEFIVVLTNIEETNNITMIASKLLDNVNRNCNIHGHDLHTSPSIGISVFPDDGQDVETLMKNADSAMYHAKEMGRNNYQFYKTEINSLAHEYIKMEHDIITALRKKEFQLYYQPKIKADNEKVCGVEALIRWKHPEKGLVAPDKFIAVAESSGLISQVGDWVLEEACRQLAEWRRQGLDLGIAINISPTQLRDETLIDRLRELINNYEVPEEMLELEITETAAMTNLGNAIGLMQQMRATGVSLAIDDFGTGYSSLSSLKSFPIQTLKLDRTFVSDIEHNINDAAICSGAISLAHSLGLKVIAEGVETRAQLDFLLSHQCDAYQGYLYSPPIPAEDILALINKLKH